MPKTYDQWSGRAKQLGWNSNQYSQAAYQGYLNNVSQAASAPAPRPAPQQQQQQLQPIQQNQQITSLQNQVEQLTQSIGNQSYGNAPAPVQSMAENLAGLNSTVLTGGVNALKKKKPSYLTPIGAD